jgi:hypothetical protein
VKKNLLRFTPKYAYGVGNQWNMFAKIPYGVRQYSSDAAFLERCMPETIYSIT